MQIRKVLSFFFLANNIEEHQGEVLGLIKPLSNHSCNWTLSSCNSAGAILYEVIEIGDVPGCNSITKSTSFCRGNPGSFFGKTSSYSQTIRSRSNSYLALSFKVRLANKPCNFPCHLELYTVWCKASCLSP